MQKQPNSFDYQKRNLGLTKAQFDVINNSPNQAEPFVGAVDDFMNINQKKKSGLQAGIEGLASGLKYGAKKGEVDRKQQLFDWLGSNIMATRQKIEYLEKQQQFLESSSPYAEALYDISNSKHLSDDERQRYKSDLLKQYQQINPEAGKFDIISSPAGQDFFVALDRATGEKKLVPYSSMMTPDSWQGLQKRNLENMKMDIQKQGMGIQQQHAVDYGRSVDSNVALHNAQIDKIKGQKDVSPEEAEYIKVQAKKSAQEGVEILGNLNKEEKEINNLENSIAGIRSALNGGAITSESVLSTGKLFLGELFGTDAFYETQNLEVAAKELLPNVKKTFGSRITDADLKLSLAYMIPNRKWNRKSIDTLLDKLEVDLISFKIKTQATREVSNENGGNLPYGYNKLINERIAHKKNTNAINVQTPDGKIWQSTLEKFDSLPVEMRNSLKIVK